MLRLFVGIEFPPALKLHLSMLETGIPGAVDEGTAADIDEALARVRARRFTLQLAGTGVFGGGKPRALWVGVERQAPPPPLLQKNGKGRIPIGHSPPPPRL